jgi:DNA replication protein DnaC
MKMDPELIKMLKYLRLSNLLTQFDHVVEKAKEEDLSPVRWLRDIIEQEYRAKMENARKLKLCRAKIPEKWLFQTFPFDRQPKLNKKKLTHLYDAFDYMTQARNIIFIGPTGAGKTGLATAFLIQAIDRGYNGRFIPFPELVDLLYKSLADHSEEKRIKTFAAYDCLLIDELGYIELEPVQVGLFFTLMQKRHKKKTTLITSNLGFEQWASFLKNDHLTAALIDRLTEVSHIVNMKNCASLRTRLSDEPPVQP